jgi:hypothetical protein
MTSCPVHSRRVATVLLVSVSGLLAGCNLGDNSITAPTNGVISIQSDASFLAANATTVITVHVKNMDGSAAAEGTEVALTATGGELDQRKLRTRNGQATVMYRAAAAGMVRITAVSGSVSAELSLRVGSATPSNLALASSAALLSPGGGEAEIVATVTSSNGAPVAGAPVTFSTTSGSVSPTEVVTNERGEARTTLRTTTSATVQASVLGYSSTAAVRVKPTMTIDVSVNPGSPTAGQAATATSSVSADGGPATGRLVFTFGDGQVRDVGTITGSGSISYTWATQGGYNLSAQFTDADGTSRATIRVTVQPAPVIVPPEPPPGGGGGGGTPPPPSVGGATIRETIAILHARYRPPLSVDSPIYGRILNEACWIHRAEGWGMIGRNGGGIVAPSGDHIDFDAVWQRGGAAYDVFEGSDYHPGWRDMTHDLNSTNYWVAPVAP